MKRFENGFFSNVVDTKMNIYNLGLEEEKAHKMFSHVFGGQTPALGALGPYSLETLNNYENRQLFDDESIKALFNPEGPREKARQDDEIARSRVFRFDDDPLKSSASYAQSIIQHQFYGTRNRWGVRGFHAGHHDHVMSESDFNTQRPAQIASELESKKMNSTLTQKRKNGLSSLVQMNSAIEELSKNEDGRALSHKRFTADLLPLKETIPDAPSGWWDTLGNMSYTAEEGDRAFGRLHRQIQPVGTAFTR